MAPGRNPVTRVAWAAGRTTAVAPRPRDGLARADRISVLAAICLTIVATALGVHTGYRTVDVDEVVYHRTLVAMQDGRGYYPAMRDALVDKEGAPPSQVRSVRPPTLYLLLSRAPAATWRYAVGGVYLAVLLMAWRLARATHRYGGPIAVLLCGMWMLGAAPFLFLHAEIWGLPFLLAAALAVRHRRWALAAVAVAVAALLREIFVLPLLVGLAVSPRRRPWVVALVVVAALGLVHAALAGHILVPDGREPAFGKSGLSPRYILSALSPSDRPAGWLLGVTGNVLGFLGLHRWWKDDPAARLVLPFAAVMVPLTVFLGREYWALSFGPAVMCFAPAGLAAFERYRDSTSSRNLPV